MICNDELDLNNADCSVYYLNGGNFSGIKLPTHENGSLVVINGDGFSSNAVLKSQPVKSNVNSVFIVNNAENKNVNFENNSDTDNSYSVIGIGDKRNVLFIKPNSITGANIQYNTDIRISSESEITSSNWDNTTEIGTRNNLINNGYSYVVENLDADDVFYLGYRRSNYGSYTYYNSQELKASELAGTGLNIQCSSN